MRRFLSLMIVVLVCWPTAPCLLAEEYRAIFWNLESGDSNDAFLASQMVAKGDIDFWGFSEVRSQTALDTFVAALEAANPDAEFTSKLSEEGGSDRLAIVYRSDRLKSVPYTGDADVDEIGDNFFEVDEINVGGTIRPALGIELEGKAGQRVIVLVNHWKCCDDPEDLERREKQAIQMNAFAIDTPAVPIISAGDFNMVDGTSEEAFQELIQIWELKELQPNVGTFRSGSVIDLVFATNKVPGWSASAQILKRSGNSPATSSTFSDNGAATDHRPILLVVESDEEEHIESLRDSIRDIEAVLARMKDELARLEAANGQ